MSAIRIFLVDDHQLVRDGIKVLLMSSDDIEILGEASTGKECFEKIADAPPDILILDISLPDTNGIEITKRITAEYPEVRVLILSMYLKRSTFTEAETIARSFLIRSTMVLCS